LPSRSASPGTERTSSTGPAFGVVRVTLSAGSNGHRRAGTYVAAQSLLQAKVLALPDCFTE
jgi:hypothetical protein